MMDTNKDDDGLLRAKAAIEVLARHASKGENRAVLVATITT